MFSIDDRAGNVATTVALFLIAATVLYLARGAFFILLLSLLFGYLLEPALALVQKHSRMAQGNRTWARRAILSPEDDRPEVARTSRIREVSTTP